MGFNTQFVSNSILMPQNKVLCMVGMSAMEDSTFLPTAVFNYTPKNLSLVKVITNSIGVGITVELEFPGRSN
jgi:hypothetical protein